MLRIIELLLAPVLPRSSFDHCEAIATVDRINVLVQFGSGNIMIDIYTPVAGCTKGLRMNPSADSRVQGHMCALTFRLSHSDHCSPRRTTTRKFEVAQQTCSRKRIGFNRWKIKSMKKLMLRLIAIGALSVPAQAALADCASSYCEDVRVLTLYTPPAPDTNSYLKVSGTTANLNCSLYAGVYVRVPSASARFKEYVANLMAVQLADRVVSFSVDSGQTTSRSAPFGPIRRNSTLERPQRPATAGEHGPVI